MTVLPFFEWCEASWLGDTIRQSAWMFPVIEAVHLLGLCVLGGALLVVDLRLLGVGLRSYPVARIARDARPWLIASLVVMLATGTALFLSESIKCYYNQSFWVKITTLPFAMAFTLVVRERVARVADSVTGRTRLVGAISFGLWFVVAAAGRWIGFS